MTAEPPLPPINPQQTSGSAIAPDSQLARMTHLLRLQAEARQALTEDALAFHMVNRTRDLLGYRQGALVLLNEEGEPHLRAVSNVARLDKNAPFVRWMLRVSKQVLTLEQHSKTHALDPDALRPDDRAEWSDWSPARVLWSPLKTPAGEMVGVLWLARDEPWRDGESLLAQRLSDAYAHAWVALTGKGGRRAGFTWKRALRWGGIAAVLIALALPVRLSVLAPAEIVPDDPVIVAAPLDGVVKTFHVEPNAAVEQGDLLISFEDASPRNSVRIAERSLAAAEAEYLTAAQGAFGDPRGAAKLAELKAQVELRRAELDQAREILSRVEVRAERAGVAVFSSTSDWIGRPARIGERIMTLADPERVEVDIRLPVEDAIVLETGADVQVFLNVNPLSPLQASLKHASHEATLTPAQILAYRVTASLAGDGDQSDLPRIGSRGTAKILGQRVPVIYYLLRRPLAAIRQAVGL